MNKVIVFSDYSCPFCYLSKKALDMLVEKHDIKLEWIGYEIHPKIPEGGMTFPEMGFDEDYIDVIAGEIKKYALQLDVEINIPERFSNSHLALLLTELASDRSVFKEFNDRVYQDYWVREIDINDSTRLYSYLEELGISRSEIDVFLKTTARERFKGNLKLVESYGVSAVPNFIVNGKQFRGLQTYEDLKKAL
ncbi:DSBA-like thioredoxin domain protein [archaeon]|nr:DSBA-like thioredoxin domain protein [archaeon]